MDKTDRWMMPPTILLAGFVLSLLLIALSGFWISQAFGLSALPGVYTVRANVFVVIGTAFCLLDATGRYGWSFASTFLLCALIGSAAVEFVGITTGSIFGTYHYNPAMQAQLFGVLPVVVPFGWFIFSYLAFATARALLRKNAPLLLRAAVATALLVAYDLASDPNQVYRGVWTYVHGGGYYGVPLQNFAAWAVLGFIGMLVLEFICRRKAIFPESRRILPLPVIAYGAVVLHEGMFALFMARHPIAGAIAFVTTGAVLAASLFRISR
jgi:putative membrane protein